MSEAIWSALIVAVSSIACQLLINNKAKNDKEKKDAVAAANLENRLKNIETKLDIHNGYAEKLGDIQLDIAVIKNDVKNMKGAR